MSSFPRKFAEQKYTYDSLNRLTRIEDDKGTTEITYNENGTVASNKFTPATSSPRITASNTPDPNDNWREDVIARIQDRLDATHARHPGTWLIVDRGGMGYDVDPLDSGMRGQFHDIKDAEFVANAADDMRTLLSILNGANHNLIEANRTIAAFTAENERLKARNDELWRMIGDRTGNA